MKKLFLVQLLLFAFACDNANEKHLGEVSDSFEESLDIPVTRQSTLAKNTTEKEQFSKKVIKTGEIKFETKQIESDYKNILKSLYKYDGYIQSENQAKDEYRINYNLVIRVSSSNYDSLLNSLARLGSKLDNKSSNIQDATERFYDLKTRIKNKKSLETRYIELLKKASNVKDILQIENNLNEVRTDIERLQGRFNYLNKQISLSTIHLSFYEILPYAYGSSQREGFGARILSSLDDGWQGFLSFLAAMISLWPFLILTFLGVYLFMKLRNRSKPKKEKTE